MIVHHWCLAYISDKFVVMSNHIEKVQLNASRFINESKTEGSCVNAAVKYELFAFKTLGLYDVLSRFGF